MQTLQDMVFKYGQEETAFRSNRGQPGICQATNSDRRIFAHEQGDSIFLFEVIRIDKTGLDVEFPKLVMPKRKKQ